MSELMDINARFDIVRVPSPEGTITLEEIIADKNRGYHAEEHFFEDGQLVDQKELLDKRMVANESERHKYADMKPRKWGATRLVTIDGLQVFGSGGILVTPDNKVIQESADILPRPGVHKHLIDAASIIEGSKFAPLPQYLDCEAVVIPYPYGSFGHDFSQRFVTIGCFTGLNIDLIYCRNDSPFMQEALSYLNIPRNIVLNPEPNHFLRFRRAHFLLRNDWNGPIPLLKKNFVDYLLKKEECTDVKPFRKIFYLRDPSSDKLVNHRYIRNRNELARDLQARGFECVIWEKLTISQKIRLVRETKFAVEESSSSIIYYLLFARHCKVLGLYGPEFISTYESFTPDFLKNNLFGILRGKNAQFASGLPNDHNNANFEIDLEEFDFMISEMENKDFSDNK